MGDKKKTALGEEDLQYIRDVGIKARYPKNHIIFAAGDLAYRVYLIEEGWVKNYRLDTEGRKVTVGNIRNPGELIGLAEALNQGERMCFASSLTEVSLVHLTNNQFNEILHEHHDLTLKVATILAERLRESEAMSHELICLQVPGRLASMLLRLANSCGVKTDEGDAIRIGLRLTHEEIASMIGTSRQTVTTILNTFKQENSIVIENREISITDVGKLNSWLV